MSNSGLVSFGVFLSLLTIHWGNYWHIGEYRYTGTQHTDSPSCLLLLFNHLLSNNSSSRSGLTTTPQPRLNVFEEEWSVILSAVISFSRPHTAPEDGAPWGSFMEKNSVRSVTESTPTEERSPIYGSSLPFFPVCLHKISHPLPSSPIFSIIFSIPLALRQRYSSAMGLLTLVEDRPTPPAVYNWRVYVLALVASCGSNMIGYTSAFIGTTITMDSFKKEFGMDTKTTEERNLISENIVSFFIAGAFFGALITYVLSHWVGRKSCLAVASGVFILGAGLQCGANGDRGLGIMYAGRILNGLGTGVASNIVPIYLSELAPPAIRGRLVGLYELGWQIGGMVGFWINVSVKAYLSSVLGVNIPSMVFKNTYQKVKNNG